MHPEKYNNIKINLNFNPTQDREFHLLKAFEILISPKEIEEYFKKLKLERVKKNGKSNQ